jgi:hypothetical protein
MGMVAVGLLALGASLAIAAGEAFTDPAKAGPDFAVQGEYKGVLKHDGKEVPLGVQVIALGGGKFDIVGYHGGLPGDGWKRGDEMEKGTGETKDGVTTFKGEHGSGKLVNGAIVLYDSGGQEAGKLEKVERKSPTLGAKPPADAKVLFDGSNVGEFPGAQMTEDKLLKAGANGKTDFQDFSLHFEFRCPFMPAARGQGRGNSGLYLQNRYELQILDSFGLSGENNECGGFYTLKEPSVNMALPPLAWQTYDIDFTGARFDGKNKIKNAKVTVKHNGVVIHDNIELAKLCPGGASEEFPGKGPFALQNHGDPVVYRNFWVVEKK